MPSHLPSIRRNDDVMSADCTAPGDATLPEYLSSVNFGAVLISTIFDSRTPLGNFCRRSMNLHMKGNSHCSSKQLWPCPIPDRLCVLCLTFHLAGADPDFT